MSSRDRRPSCTTGSWSTGRCSGTAPCLGPDYTADYLRRSANIVRGTYGGARSDRAIQATIDDFRTNRYDEGSGVLTYTAPQALAFRRLVGRYGRFFSEPSTKNGLRSEAITDRSEHRRLTAFFAWTAWAAAAERPGKEYSYTSNWPPEPRVDNGPTPGSSCGQSRSSRCSAASACCSAPSAAGACWAGTAASRPRSPSARRATSRSPRVSAPRLVLPRHGRAPAHSGHGRRGLQHYRSELSDFFGVDLAEVFPNLMRTWHIQLALFWVSTSFVAAGIFLAPMIAGREPQGRDPRLCLARGAGRRRGQDPHRVVPRHPRPPGRRDELDRPQGFEYLDLARLYQVLLSVSLFAWVFMLWRVLRRRLRSDHPANMPWLFFFAALAIPAFYAVGLIARTGGNFTVTEFWRFWVVHLWVEDFLELFTTVMVAYMFVLLGVVREKVALTVVFLDILLYSFGGVIGTMHHLYFSGEPAEHMALGAFFSAAEVIPDLPHRRGMELPAARRRAGIAFAHTVPTAGR